MIKYVAPLVAAAVVVALGTAPLASAHAPASCTPHQLPGAPGASGMGEVMWISDAGMYVGDVADTDGSFRATWWTHTGADLATGWTVHMVPGVPADSVVNDVNGYGVMVGAAFDSSQSFIYDSRSGALTWLPELPGGSWTWGRRINASGEVSGGAGDKHGGELATVWLPPYTAATKLPNVGASQSIGTQDLAHDHMFSEADGLNDAGIASGVTSLGGRVQDPSFAARNGFWRGGIAPLLAPIEWRANGRPYRLPAGAHQGYAFAINNARTAVGWADRPDYTSAPAYWLHGQVHDMGAPTDIMWGNAYGISQGGWAAGGYVLTDSVNRAFVWTGAGSLHAMDPLPGYRDSWAHAASDHFGQVGGFSSPDAAGPEVYPTVWQCPAGFTTTS